MEASKYGHVSVVWELIERNDMNLNDVDVKGNSALSRAISFQHYDIVKFLLLLPNIEVNYQNRFGDSPLLIAVGMPNSRQIVKSLLKVRIDLLYIWFQNEKWGQFHGLVLGPQIPSFSKVSSQIFLELVELWFHLGYENISPDHGEKVLF